MLVQEFQFIGLLLPVLHQQCRCNKKNYKSPTYTVPWSILTGQVLRRLVGILWCFTISWPSHHLARYLRSE